MTDSGTPHLDQVSTIAGLADLGPLPQADDPQSMRARGQVFWEEGSLVAGAWECDPGPSRWTFETNEFIYILAGSMTVTRDGGSAVRLKAGDTAVFPVGWTGTWTIHEPIRKVYNLF